MSLKGHLWGLGLHWALSALAALLTVLSCQVLHWLNGTYTHAFFCESVYYECPSEMSSSYSITVFLQIITKRYRFKLFLILPFYFCKFGRGVGLGFVIVTIIESWPPRAETQERKRETDTDRRRRGEGEKEREGERESLERLLESVSYWIRVFHVQPPAGTKIIVNVSLWVPMDKVNEFQYCDHLSSGICQTCPSSIALCKILCQYEGHTEVPCICPHWKVHSERGIEHP